MDYNIYYDSIEKIKTFLQKNYTLLDTAYVIYDQEFKALDLDIILWDTKLKTKLNRFLKNNQILANITYFTQNEFKAQFDNKLDKEFVYNKFLNSWHIYGKGKSSDYFSYLKKHYSGESIIYRKEEILVKDLIYDVRWAAGALIYNPKIKKFLIIKHNIDGENYWALPKGGIEEGELPIDAAKREIFEESGIKDIKMFKDVFFISVHNFKSKHDNNIKKAYGIYFPAVTNQEFISLSDEHNNFEWLSLEELKEKISFPISKYFANKLGSWLLKKYG